MTREHKLALIVGFSLVLVLTVLVSDHFSKARQVAMDEKAAAATPVKVGVLPPGMRYSADPAVDSRIIQDPTAAPASGNSLGMAPQGPLPSVNPAAPRPAIADPTLPPNGGSQVAQSLPGGSGVAGAAGTPATPLAGTGSTALSPQVRPVVESSNIGQRMPIPGIPGAGEGGAAPGSVLPTTPAAPQIPMKRHDVREGDSAFGIARQYYGDGKLWEKLREYNKDRIGSRGELRDGVTILLPPKDVLLGKPYQPEAAAVPAVPAAPKSPLVPPAKPDPTRPAKPDTRIVDAGDAGKGFKEYTIQSGDTLGTVARKTLGSSKRWQEIADANPRLDPESLVVGTKIKIPATPR